MALKFLNNARQLTGTLGNGPITLGSVPAGWQSFADAGAVDGNEIPVEIRQGDEWEDSLLTLASGATVGTRNVLSSSNGGLPLDLDGSAAVTCVPLAEVVVPRSRQITTSGLLTGGGDFGADRAFAVPAASQATAEAGSNNTDAMTALRTRQAILAVMKVVASGSVNNAATLDIALPGGYNYFDIMVNHFRPVTDATIFRARFSQGGVFLSGASDYAWTMIRSTTVTTDAADAHMDMRNSVGSAGDGVNIIIRIPAPFKTGRNVVIQSIGGDTSSAGTLGVLGHANGCFIANTNAVDGIRLFFSAGNISSGTYVVRGFKDV